MLVIETYFEYTNHYKQEYETDHIMVLLQVGEWFEIYGYLDDDDQKHTKWGDFGRICDLRVQPIATFLQDRQTVKGGFKCIYFDKYISMLLNDGFVVPVYVQVKDSAGIISRVLDKVYIPSMELSDSLTFDFNKINNYSACIWIEITKHTKMKYNGAETMIHIGVALLDSYTGQTEMSEISNPFDHPKTADFDELERLMMIYQPQEIICIVKNVEGNALQNLFSKAKIDAHSKRFRFVDLDSSATKATHDVKATLTQSSTYYQRAINCMKQTYQVEIIHKFFPNIDIIDSFLQQPFGNQAYCFLLDYIYQHEPTLLTRIVQPSFNENGQLNKMILSNGALKQLLVISPENQYCVSKLLNQCKTKMGKRKLNSMLFNPITDIAKLNQEYDVVEACLHLHNVLLLRNVVDMASVNRQIYAKTLRFPKLCQLYTSILQIERCATLLYAVPEFMSYINNKIVALPDFKSLLTYLEQTIDFETNNSSIPFRRCVYVELDDLLNKNVETQTKINNFMSEISGIIRNATQKGGEDIEYVSLKTAGFVLTNKRAKILDDYLNAHPNHHYNGLVFKPQNKTETLIVYPLAPTWINWMEKGNDEVEQLVAKLYADFLQQLDTLYGNTLEYICMLATYMDTVITRAHLAKTMAYCKPVIQQQDITQDTQDSAYMNATVLRHCLAEKTIRDEIYVGNDVQLGQSGILLFGTNKVGKSTLVKSIGIAIILAQSGFFVPATSFTFSPYKHLFTRLVGDDDMLRNKSALEVEMDDFGVMLRQADENSLVLGDELCKGTEQSSAISIMVTGLKWLHDKFKSSFIFATHMHEIVKYPEITSLKRLQMKHLTVSYNRALDTLVFDRKLKDGSGPNMYGLEVCKSLGLPHDFIEEANEIRLKYFPDNYSGQSLLDAKQSRYNSALLRTTCPCGQPATETHHLWHQCDANELGIITPPNQSPFHKNHQANVVNTCEKCHHENYHNGHKEKQKMMKKVKTLEKGLQITPV